MGDLDAVGDVRLVGAQSEQVAVASNSHEVRLWTLANNSWRLLRGHSNTVLGLAGTHDGLRLASGSKDATVRIWSVTEAKEDTLLQGHTGSVNAVCWARSGAWLVSVGVDRTLKVGYSLFYLYFFPLTSVCFCF